MGPNGGTSSMHHALLVNATAHSSDRDAPVTQSTSCYSSAASMIQPVAASPQTFMQLTQKYDQHEAPSQSAMDPAYHANMTQQHHPHQQQCHHSAHPMTYNAVTTPNNGFYSHQYQADPFNPAHTMQMTHAATAAAMLAPASVVDAYRDPHSHQHFLSGNHATLPTAQQQQQQSTSHLHVHHPYAADRGQFLSSSHPSAPVYPQTNGGPASSYHACAYPPGTSSTPHSVVHAPTLMVNEVVGRIADSAMIGATLRIPGSAASQHWAGSNQP